MCFCSTQWPKFCAAIAEGKHNDLNLQAGCIAYDAKITLTDGQLVPVQKLRVGDQVRSKVSGAICTGVVTSINAILASAVVFADGRPLCTESQPLMMNDDWTAAETLLEPGSPYSLVAGKAVAFTLHVSPTHSFVVNGHWAHNK